MYIAGNDIDIEKPFQDACERGDLLAHYTRREAEDIWLSLTDSDKAYDFVSNNVIDVTDELAKLVNILADAKSNITYKKGESAAFMRLAFNQMVEIVDAHVQQNAQSKAESNMEAGDYEICEEE